MKKIEMFHSYMQAIKNVAQDVIHASDTADTEANLAWEIIEDVMQGLISVYLDMFDEENGKEESEKYRYINGRLDELEEQYLQLGASRCKDCKWWEYFDEGDFGILYGGCRNPHWFHTTSNGLETTTGDDCCSWAERKEE